MKNFFCFSFSIEDLKIIKPVFLCGRHLMQEKCWHLTTASFLIIMPGPLDAAWVNNGSEWSVQA